MAEPHQGVDPSEAKHVSERLVREGMRIEPARAMRVIQGPLDPGEEGTQAMKVDEIKNGGD